MVSRRGEAPGIAQAAASIGPPPKSLRPSLRTGGDPAKPAGTGWSGSTVTIVTITFWALGRDLLEDGHDPRDVRAPLGELITQTARGPRRGL